MIGDPSGRSTERAMLTTDEVESQRRAHLRAAAPFPGLLTRARRRRSWSTTWSGPRRMSAIDFLRDIGKHFPINAMLDKESVRNRLDGGGLTFTEFSYQLLQAADFLELLRRYDCRLQIGGSDQWGNITAGLDLIRRVTGEPAHGLTVPLVTNASGEKFGKSTGGGRVWLDPELTSPVRLLPVLPQHRRPRRRHLLAAVHRPRPRRDRGSGRGDAGAPARPRGTAPAGRRVHCAAARRRRGRKGDRRVRRHCSAAARWRSCLASTLARGRGGSTRAWRSRADAVGTITVVELARATRGLCRSRSDARRAIEQGGMYVNNVKVTDENAVLGGEQLLAGGVAVLRRGRQLGAVRVT